MKLFVLHGFANLAPLSQVRSPPCRELGPAGRKMKPEIAPQVSTSSPSVDREARWGNASGSTFSKNSGLCVLSALLGTSLDRQGMSPHSPSPYPVYVSSRCTYGWANYHSQQHPDLPLISDIRNCKHMKHFIRCLPSARLRCRRRGTCCFSGQHAVSRVVAGQPHGGLLGLACKDHCSACTEACAQLGVGW